LQSEAVRGRQALTAHYADVLEANAAFEVLEGTRLAWPQVPLFR
jgi:hypothetical protein